MRSASFVLGAALGLASWTVIPARCLADSAYRVATPDPGGCDVVVNEGNAAVTLTLAGLNDPAKRVFCVEPGDYRSAGMVHLLASGTEGSRRYLRFHATDGLRNALERPERALFHALRIRGSWWVVQGLTVQPLVPGGSWFIGIEGGDHDVIEGNLVDGFEHAGQASEVGIAVAAFGSDPATHNVIQNNVVRSGNASGAPVDYIGVAVFDGSVAGTDNDWNEVLDNEIYDWGDGVAVVGVQSGCDFPARPHGTLIDGNDIYLTGAKRIDCADGTPDPAGECACAENGVDIKPDPGPDPQLWTRVTNNRLWGFRPTREPSTCGGSGSRGQAITAGNACAGHVLVAGNVVTDSSVGIKPSGPGWVIAANLVHDLRSAIIPQSDASGLEIHFNTIVGVDTAYDDMSTFTDTRCNVVVDNLALGAYGGPRGTAHQTQYNFLYDSPIANFGAGTNQVYATAEESMNTEFCYWRKRWTAPERICVPFAWTTPASPHTAALANCEPELGAPFGLPPIAYHSIQRVPEPGATQLAAAALLALLVGSPRARVRSARPREERQ